MREFLQERYPEAVSISLIAREMEMNRGAVAKYLEVLQSQGHVVMKPFGKAKLYTSAQNVPFDDLFDYLSDAILILDALLDSMAGRLVQGAAAGYIPPPTFYAVGGHKIFRDAIYGGMRFVFQADYRYYCGHGMFDFPQADLKTRMLNAVMIPLTRIPGFRKKVFADMKHHMIEPFAPVLGKA